MFKHTLILKIISCSVYLGMQFRFAWQISIGSKSLILCYFSNHCVARQLAINLFSINTLRIRQLMRISFYSLPMISVLRQKFFPVLRSEHFSVPISIKLYLAPSSRFKIQKNKNVTNLDARECLYIANKTMFI